VGGRLIPRLLAGGHRVRAMARSPERLRCRAWGGHERLEIVAGDALDREAFMRAASGCGVAYYLIHIVLEGNAERVWATVRTIGGTNGWYFAQGLWWLRGIMDRLVGGPGLRRGRRHPTDMRVGDGLDFWRVIAVEPPHRLLLLAEMKTPGDALLEFVISPEGKGRVELKMISRFLPRGLAGILYWYVLLPTHRWLFEGMLRAVASKTGLAFHSGPETAEMSSTFECRL
jgi:hypothetical protein